MSLAAPIAAHVYSLLRVRQTHKSVGTLVRKVSFVFDPNDLCGPVGSVQTAVNSQNSRNSVQ